MGSKASCCSRLRARAPSSLDARQRAEHTLHDGPMLGSPLTGWVCHTPRMVGRWRRSAGENKYLAAERKLVEERLERSRRAAAERQAKQLADEGEVVQAATEEGRRV